MFSQPHTLTEAFRKSFRGAPYAGPIPGTTEKPWTNAKLSMEQRKDGAFTAWAARALWVNYAKPSTQSCAAFLLIHWLCCSF